MLSNSTAVRTDAVKLIEPHLATTTLFQTTTE